VIGIERIPELAAIARTHLTTRGRDNVEVALGDGSTGWPAAAPYDAILVSAAAHQVPGTLVAELVPGGRLVIPVGPEDGTQILTAFTHGRELRAHALCPCRFVPLLPGGPAGSGTLEV